MLFLDTASFSDSGVLMTSWTGIELFVKYKRFWFEILNALSDLSW